MVDLNTDGFVIQLFRSVVTSLEQIRRHRAAHSFQLHRLNLVWGIIDSICSLLIVPHAAVQWFGAVCIADMQSHRGLRIRAKQAIDAFVQSDRVQQEMAGHALLLDGHVAHLTMNHHFTMTHQMGHIRRQDIERFLAYSAMEG